MRERIFRGKCNNKEWVNGFYVMYSQSINQPYSYTDGRHYIITVPHNLEYAVNPETICEYIGLFDYHKNRIFEKDIVEIIWKNGDTDKYLIWWNQELSMMTAISLKNLQFNGHDYLSTYPPHIDYGKFCLMTKYPDTHIKNIKVIGNMIDNPDLLER